MSVTGGLRLAAPAKLNLSLRVTGRRPDGYHELVGVMALIDLADDLLLLPGCSGLRVTGEARGGVPVSPGDNLAWQGLVLGLGAGPLDCCLALDKRVPAMAGLGGGSSDAAAAWRLGRRWSGADDTATPAERSALARLGADVPFFAASVPRAVVRGIGERVTPSPERSLEPPGSTIVLVHPAFGLSTAAVFAELRRSEWADTEDEPVPGDNALLAPALRLRPEIADLMRLVLAAGLDPHMTGSGPSLYAITDDPPRAAAAARRLERAGVRTTTTRLRREPARIEVVAGSDEEDP